MSRVITIQHSLFSKQTNSSEMNEPIFGKKNRKYSRWSPVEEGVTLAWQDLTVYVKNRKNLKPKLIRIVSNGKFTNNCFHFSTISIISYSYWGGKSW